MSNIHDMVKAGSCPFCREPQNDAENKKRLMKRVKANDPAAMFEVGQECFLKGDYNSALKYLIKAAELGDLMAHHQLGFMYGNGKGVEEDQVKAVCHAEKAAIGGHPGARYNLASVEERNGNVERSVKHLIIAANLGEEDSMKVLWKHYSGGNITKKGLDATLRTHQAALDAMKSEQRNAADVAFQGFRETNVLRLRGM
jgi:TPR repeat protein